MKKTNYLLIDCGNTASDFYGANLSIKQNVFCKIDNKDILSSNISKLIDYIAEYIELKKFDEIFITSVNNKVSDCLINSFLKNSQIHLLDRSIMKTFTQKHNYKISNIDILGSDLFCDIISSKDTDNGVIVLDCGTASKILVIDKNLKFLGGIIYPGINICNTILSDKTELLDDYGLIEPNNIISLDTKQAIASGTIYGTYYLVTGLVDKIKQDYQMKNPNIYLTGGNSEFIYNSKIFDKSSNFIYDPLFVLKGLARAFGLEFETDVIAHINIDTFQFKENN